MKTNTLGKRGFAGIIALVMAFIMLAGCGETSSGDWTHDKQVDGSDTPGTYVTYAYEASGQVVEEGDVGADILLDATLTLNEDGNGVFDMYGTEIPLSWHDGYIWYQGLADQGQEMYRYVANKDELILNMADDTVIYYMHKEGSKSNSGFDLYHKK